MGNLNMFKERNPQACLTKGSLMLAVTLGAVVWTILPLISTDFLLFLFFLFKIVSTTRPESFATFLDLSSQVLTNINCKG